MGRPPRGRGGKRRSTRFHARFTDYTEKRSLLSDGNTKSLSAEQIQSIRRLMARLWDSQTQNSNYPAVVHSGVTENASGSNPTPGSSIQEPLTI